MGMGQNQATRNWTSGFSSLGVGSFFVHFPAQPILGLPDLPAPHRHGHGKRPYEDFIAFDLTLQDGDERTAWGGVRPKGPKKRGGGWVTLRLRLPALNIGGVVYVLVATATGLLGGGAESSF